MLPTNKRPNAVPSHLPFQYYSTLPLWVYLRARQADIPPWLLNHIARGWDLILLGECPGDFASRVRNHLGIVWDKDIDGVFL